MQTVPTISTLTEQKSSVKSHFTRTFACCLNVKSAVIFDNCYTQILSTHMLCKKSFILNSCCHSFFGSSGAARPKSMSLESSNPLNYHRRVEGDEGSSKWVDLTSAPGQVMTCQSIHSNGGHLNVFFYYYIYIYKSYIVRGWLASHMHSYSSLFILYFKYTLSFSTSKWVYLQESISKPHIISVVMMMWNGTCSRVFLLSKSGWHTVSLLDAPTKPLYSIARPG